MRAPLLLSLLLSLPLAAQPLSFGEPFPAAGVRYETAGGSPLVVSNGRSAVLFWLTDHRVRATPLSTSDSRASYAVLDVEPGGSFDAVWTGEHFLVVATRYGPPDAIVARLVAPHGEPFGEQFTIVNNARHPRIAFNGTSALLLYEPTPTNDVWSLMLDANGRATAPARHVGLRAGALSAVASNGDGFAAAIPRGPQLEAVIFDGNGNVTARTLIESSGAAAIASDGRRYLIVTVEESATNAYARILEPNGTVGPRLQLEPPALIFFRGPSAAWTGSQWVVSYSRYPEDDELRVVYLDANAQNVQHRDQRRGVGGMLGVVGGQPVIAHVPEGDIRNGVHIGNVAVTVAPASQFLGAAASSSDASMIAWVERGKLRAGIRRSDGRWTEREVFAGPTFNVFGSASDGREFALLFLGETGSYVLRLDANAQPIGAPMLINTFAPNDILWNGREYILVADSGNLVTAPLGGTPRTVLNTGGLEHVLVSNGDGYFAAWITPGPRGNHEPTFPPGGVAGIRLDRDFRPLDPAPTQFVANDFITALDAAWDGTQYVVVWKEKRGVVANGKLIAAEPATHLAAGPIGFTWMSGTTQRFATIDRAPVTLDENVQITAAPHVARDGVVRSSRENAPPHEGTSRIMMIAAAAALPSRPDAPRATGELRGNTFTLTWTAPPQTVSGYRVEVRVGEGPWVEVEGTFSPEQRSFSGFAIAGAHAYRVRAWNDAGLGEYSENVMVRATRRRIVR